MPGRARPDGPHCIDVCFDVRDYWGQAFQSALFSLPLCSLSLSDREERSSFADWICEKQRKSGDDKRPS